MVEQYFEDALERKNQVIQRLLCDLDENEEQYSTMLHTHIGNIEILIGLHSERIGFWKTAYQDEKRSLLNQYHEEMQNLRDVKFKSFRELECVYYGLESRVVAAQNDANDHHMRRCDNVKSGVNIY